MLDIHRMSNKLFYFFSKSSNIPRVWLSLYTHRINALTKKKTQWGSEVVIRGHWLNQQSRLIWCKGQWYTKAEVWRWRVNGSWHGQSMQHFRNVGRVKNGQAKWRKCNKNVGNVNEVCWSERKSIGGPWRLLDHEVEGQRVLLDVWAKAGEKDKGFKSKNKSLEMKARWRHEDSAKWKRKGRQHWWVSYFFRGYCRGLVSLLYLLSLKSYVHMRLYTKSENIDR